MTHNKQEIEIPGRCLAMIKASTDTRMFQKDQIFEVRPNFLLTNEHPNLIIVPMMHIMQGEKHDCMPMILINFNEDEKIFLRKGEILGHLEPSSIVVNEIAKEDWPEKERTEGEENEAIPPWKKSS